MKLFKMKKILILFTLLSATLCFTGCGKKHVAAVIVPSTEFLETQRAEEVKKVEEEKRYEKESALFKLFVSSSGYVPSVKSVKDKFVRIEEELSKRKDLILVDRNRINDIIAQHEFEQSAWSNSNKVAEIGQALNADILIFIEAENFFYNNNLSVEFLDINTFRKRIINIAFWVNGTEIRTNADKRKLRKIKLD